MRDHPQTRDPLEGSRGSRERYSSKGRSYSITERQARVIHDLGRFRVVRTDALARHAYDGDRAGLQEDLRNLRRQGLAVVHHSRPQGGGEAYAVLSTAGRELTAEHLRSNPQQAVYSGLKRPREIRHDAAVYEAYHHARRKLEGDGSRVTRVQLDYELKRNVARDVRAASSPDVPYAQTVLKVAARHSLPVQEDGVAYPDVQVEYERADGTLGRANLEVVTEHYKESALAEKSTAGFSLYLPSDSPGARGAPSHIHSLAEELFEI